MFTIIAAPFRFLRWAFTNGWKGIIVLMVVIVLVIVAFFVMRHYITESMNDGKPAASTIVQVTAGLPTAKQAPYEVTTWSRTYYAVKAVKNKNGSVTMTDYWEVNKNKWIFTKGLLNLDESFGKVSIKKRPSL